MFGTLSEAEVQQIVWNLVFNWERKGHTVGVRSYGKMGRMPVRLNVGIVR